MTVEFENPPHPKVLRFIISILLIPIVIGIIVWVVGGALNSKVLVPIVGMIIGVIFSTLLIIRFYYWSPVRLIVSDKGISLTFRTKRETHAGWEDISILYVGSTEPTGFYGIPKESMIKLKGDFRPKIIVLEAALLIKAEWIKRLDPTEIPNRIKSW